MLFIFGRKKLEEEICRIQDIALSSALRDLKEIQSVVDLRNDVTVLTARKTELEIQVSKLKEDRDRNDREIEHKIGLERKRQEFEISAGKREAVLQVQQENLNKDKQRFEEQMKFNTERLTEETKYLKDLMTQILKRLPDISLDVKRKGVEQ